jgi:hypothetical protein
MVRGEKETDFNPGIYTAKTPVERKEPSDRGLCEDTIPGDSHAGSNQVVPTRSQLENS